MGAVDDPRRRRRLLAGLLSDATADIDLCLIEEALASKGPRASVRSGARLGALAIRSTALSVAFADGTEQRIDFAPVLNAPLFGALPDPSTFHAVVVDPEAGTLVWPNGADFDPATLHDWPDVSEELARRARFWAAPPSDPRADTPMELTPLRGS